MASLYPGAIDDQTSLYNPADAFSGKPLTTTLAALCLDTDTTLQLAATVSSLGGPAAYGILTIDDEEIVYAAASGANVTGCQRGAFGTTAIGHSAGSTVRWRYVKAFDAALQAAVQAIQATLGVAGDYSFLQDPGGNGLAARTAQGVTAARSIAAGGGMSVADGDGVSGNPTVTRKAAVNKQTGTSYTIVDGDRGKLVTFTNASAIAASIAQAGSSGNFADGWFVDVENRGAGTLTITPATSTIDGASSLALTTNQGVRLFSDGSNYFTQRGVGGGSGTPGGSNTQVQYNDSGAFGGDAAFVFNKATGQVTLTDILQALGITALRNDGGYQYRVKRTSGGAAHEYGFAIHGSTGALLIDDITNSANRITVNPSTGNVDHANSLSVAGGQAVSGIVTTVGNPGVDTNVPTEKAVRDAIVAIAATIDCLYSDVTGGSSSATSEVTIANISSSGPTNGSGRKIRCHVLVTGDTTYSFAVRLKFGGAVVAEYNAAWTGTDFEVWIDAVVMGISSSAAKASVQIATTGGVLVSTVSLTSLSNTNIDVTFEPTALSNATTGICKMLLVEVLRPPIHDE